MMNELANSRDPPVEGCAVLVQGIQDERKAFDPASARRSQSRSSGIAGGPELAKG